MKKEVLVATAVAFPFTPLDNDVLADDTTRRRRFAQTAQATMARLEELRLPPVPAEGSERWSTDFLLSIVVDQLSAKANRPHVLTGSADGPQGAFLYVVLELLARGIHAEALIDDGQESDIALIVH